METVQRIGDINVHIEGAGTQTIMLVHGWPDTYRVWDAQVEALKSNYRCVRFTLPGFEIGKPRAGHSLDEIIELCRQVVELTSPDRPVTLLLHDWGCLFGYQFALRHPTHVARIIGVDVGDAGSRTHARSLSPVAKLFTVAYQGWLALAWRVGGRIGDGMTRWLARRFRSPGAPQTIGAHMNYPYYIRWTGAFGSYRGAKPFKPSCPMLFIYGQHSPVRFHSPPWAAALAASPGNRVVELPTGHWAMRDASTEFNRLVIEWLGARAPV